MEKQKASKVLDKIEKQRTWQMQRIIDEILYNVDGIELIGIDKGTGLYLGDAEYTSNIRLRVEKGKEKIAQALMSLIAQATRQDAFIENFEDKFSDITTNKKQERIGAPTSIVRFKEKLTSEQKAAIKQALDKAGIEGATITDTFVTASDFGAETRKVDLEFYNKIKKVIEDVISKSNLFTGDTQDVGKGVGHKASRKTSLQQGEQNTQASQAENPSYEITNGYNVSNYNEGETQGNERSYSSFYGANSIIEGTDRTPQQILGEINRTLSQTDHQLDDLQTFTTSFGEVYGFIDPKTLQMYLDEDKITPEHPLHEYTHIWHRNLSII